MSLLPAKICVPLACADSAPLVLDSRLLLPGTGDDRGVPGLIQDEGFADIDTQRLVAPAGGADKSRTVVTWRRPLRSAGSRRASPQKPHWVCSPCAT